jgi:hypothetical protein
MEARFDWAGDRLVRQPRIKLHCGKCRGVLDTFQFVGTPEEPMRELVPSRRSHAGAVRKPPPSGGSETYPCPRKGCGAAYSIRLEDIAVACEEAVRDGRTELVAGVDV